MHVGILELSRLVPTLFNNEESLSHLEILCDDRDS
mgnify:CR=1 FL=1